VTTAQNEIFSEICKYLSENETPIFRENMEKGIFPFNPPLNQGPQLRNSLCKGQQVHL
jgi:hypothetical protein